MKSALIALCLGLGCTVARADVPQQTNTATQEQLDSVDTLNIDRYMGVWYEIAKYPNWFQRHCVANASAQYSLLDNRQVRVVNRCVEEDGEIKEKAGVARQLGSADSPRLEVSFAPTWLSLVPAVWADYWVIDIDPGYTLAAVSEPTRNYLWVLSRTPHVDPQRYQQLLQRLRARGFDTSKLVLTQQD
jgi:apolipoprotein D and lipocalin family protein